MPRNAPSPLDAGIVKIEKGAARPLGQSGRRAPPLEARIGITIRLPESVHEQLRVLAFQRRCSKQALIEGWVAEQLATVKG